MTKELFEVLNKIRHAMLNSRELTLSKKELHLILKYINELEKEISGDYEDNN